MSFRGPNRKRAAWPPTVSTRYISRLAARGHRLAAPRSPSSPRPFLEALIAAERPAAVTLLTTEDYLPGSIVLGHSLRAHGWSHPMVIMVTPRISPETRQKLTRWWDRVVEVEPIPNPVPPEEQWFPYFAELFTKFHIWHMVEYDKIVFIDSDIVVTGSMEELLERPRFAAAPCQTPSDTLNSGVLVVEPDEAVFADLMDKLGKLPTHDGSDQGFLNNYFPDWFSGPGEHRLPCIYNVNQTLYLARMGWQRILPDMRALHFVSPAKPWKKRYYRFSRFGYRFMARRGGASGMTTPPEIWMQAWREATGQNAPPWKYMP